VRVLDHAATVPYRGDAPIPRVDDVVLDRNTRGWASTVPVARTRVPQGRRTIRTTFHPEIRPLSPARGLGTETSRWPGSRRRCRRKQFDR
jgi:hypothetical protein